MAKYLVKRTREKIKQSGVKIVGPVDEFGTPLPGASTQLLTFDRMGETVAKADLVVDQYYVITVRFYGEKGAELKCTTKPAAGVGDFKDFFSFEIPDEAPETLLGHAHSDSKIAKVPVPLS
jgi:hypothetical protein